MDKNKTLDQLFEKARNQEPQYSFTKAADRFSLASSQTSGSKFTTKHSFFSFKFWLMLSSIITALTTTLFLIQDNVNPNRIEPEKNKSKVVFVDSNTNEKNIVHNNMNLKLKTTISHPPLFINQLVDSISINKNISFSEQIEPKMEDRQTAQKFDDPYIFPKLTEKEIKETQKQKKVMLRALEKMDKKSYAFIPNGSIEYNGRKVSVQSFIMHKTEVSNLEYRTFLFDLLIQGRKEEFLKAKPDQQQWNNLPGGQNNKMVEYYFSHPAYDNYPVVNISREGAEMYCKWLTKELMKVVDEKKKTLYNPVRLPVREEWIKATCLEPNKNIYPWHGEFMRNKDGLFEANFRLSESEMNNRTNAYSAYSVDITAPVNSYFPNYYGIHNLSGNVAEMVYNDSKTKSAGTAGGGWMNVAEELKIFGPDPFSGVTTPHPGIGFRVVMTTISAH